VNGEVAEKSIDMVSRVFGQEMPCAMKFVYEGCAVMVDIVCLLWLNEALI
jgi:hypothetical protein